MEEFSWEERDALVQYNKNHIGVTSEVDGMSVIMESVCEGWEESGISSSLYTCKF